MSQDSILEAIRAQGVIPVLRNASAEDAVATAEACGRAGMKVVELTCSTPEVERAIAALAAQGFRVGLGTVLSAEQVEGAAAAGAEFVVSFAAPAAALQGARENGLLAIPGAFTPSEFLACVEGGAELVKLFPARAAGPAYLRDLRSVMPTLQIVATGGIAIGDGSIATWLEAGAVAVGLGSSLGTASAIGVDQVTDRAAAALAEARAKERGNEER